MTEETFYLCLMIDDDVSRIAVLCVLSAEWLGDVRVHPSNADLPAGTVAWSTPLSSLRVQIPSGAFSCDCRI